MDRSEPLIRASTPWQRKPVAALLDFVAEMPNLPGALCARDDNYRIFEASVATRQPVRFCATTW